MHPRLARLRPRTTSTRTFASNSRTAVNTLTASLDAARAAFNGSPNLSCTRVCRKVRLSCLQVGSRNPRARGAGHDVPGVSLWPTISALAGNADGSEPQPHRYRGGGIHTRYKRVTSRSRAAEALPLRTSADTQEAISGGGVLSVAILQTWICVCAENLLAPPRYSSWQLNERKRVVLGVWRVWIHA